MSATPGPWIYAQTPLQRVVSEVEIEQGSQLRRSRVHIADVRGWGGLQYRDDGAEMQDANGELLAAAPALRDACKVALSALRGEVSPAVAELALEQALEKAGA